METLLSAEGGLIGVFLASFLAATVVPFSSEAALLGYLRLHPDHTDVAIVLATVGNTGGGMTTFALGRFFPRKNLSRLELVRRYGAPILLFAWLPFVGDAICAAAGWLRVHWLSALAFMALGRYVRYLLVAQL